MKPNELLKPLLAVLLLALLPQTAAAYDFMVDGLCYEYNSDGTSVMVTNQNSSDPHYTDLSGDLVIPETVTYSGTTYSVTTIGWNAFSGCSELTSITIPNSVTGIYYQAFSNCSGLTSVTIPNSVKIIAPSVFDGTAWYNNQPDGLVYAGLVAYKYKGTMPDNTNIDIVEGTKSISDNAFQNCRGLTTVTIPNSVTYFGFYAFSGCRGLTSVNIGNSVTSIGGHAFEYCSGLTEVTIPNSVTSIGNNAFSGCSGLTEVTIPNSVTTIGSDAFYDCIGLTSVTIGNSVTSIGNNAFKGCSGLTEVTIPNSVTTIGSLAFVGCI